MSTCPCKPLSMQLSICGCGCCNDSPATRTSEQQRCDQASLLLHPGWQVTSMSRPVQRASAVDGGRLDNVFWPHYKWVSSTITTTASGDSGQCLCRHPDICTDIAVRGLGWERITAENHFICNPATCPARPLLDWCDCWGFTVVDCGQRCLHYTH